MNLTISVEEDVVRKAEVLGTSIDQLVREYLEQFAGRTDAEEAATEFERLSKMSQGNSQGWQFNRDEVHQR